ncbi:hypothetical protein KEM52_005092, partial [Ascosphaera acerosa]
MPRPSCVPAPRQSRHHHRNAATPARLSLLTLVLANLPADRGPPPVVPVDATLPAYVAGPAPGPGP